MFSLVNLYDGVITSKFSVPKNFSDTLKNHFQVNISPKNLNFLIWLKYIEKILMLN